MKRSLFCRSFVFSVKEWDLTHRVVAMIRSAKIRCSIKTLRRKRKFHKNCFQLNFLERDCFTLSIAFSSLIGESAITGKNTWVSLAAFMTFDYIFLIYSLLPINLFDTKEKNICLMVLHVLLSCSVQVVSRKEFFYWFDYSSYINIV